MEQFENLSGTASPKSAISDRQTSEKAMHPGCKIALPTYNGGKSGSGTYQTIINQQPQHDIFISAFLGHCGVLRNKRQAAFNIGVDIDAKVIDTWKNYPAFENHSDIVFFKDDALNWLKRWHKHGQFGTNVLLYCDPPYLMSTRTGGPCYKHEMTDAQHLHLLSLLKTLPCMVQISGYPSELYDRELSGWRKIEFDAMTRQGKKRECLWMNYPEPKVLHTTWYVGADYRERERIKRKAVRWVSKFLAMPAAEQQFILEQLHAVNGDDRSPSPTGEFSDASRENGDAAAPLFFGVDLGDPRGDISVDAAGNTVTESDIKSKIISLLDEYPIGTKLGVTKVMQIVDSAFGDVVPHP